MHPAVNGSRADALEHLVVDDRERGLFKVKRESMTSPEVLALEQERVFDRCWLYLGHESEIGDPGDFRRRNVAGRPLVFVRGSDGVIRAFFNSCPHRGARVCRQDQGNAKAFQCFYHAWTFNNRGDLVGIPDRDGYSDGFDPAEHGLVHVPRLESYRGFCFVAFDPEIESLSDYLAGAKEYIDLIADHSAAGMRIVPGSHQYACNANWKLMLENSADGYHGAPLHHTYFSFLASYGDDSAPKRLKEIDARGYDLGNGHAVVDYPSPYPRPISVWHPMFGEDAKAEMEALQRELEERCGPERAYRIGKTSRNLLIYPNLALLDVMSIAIRVFWPKGPDRMELSSWALGPRDESPAGLVRRLENYNLFLGPGGLASPDDVEALEACQEGFAATAGQYSDISRGMHRPAGTVDELQMRAFWREWHANIQGLGHADHDDELAGIATSGGQRA